MPELRKALPKITLTDLQVEVLGECRAGLVKAEMKSFGHLLVTKYTVRGRDVSYQVRRLFQRKLIQRDRINISGHWQYRIVTTKAGDAILHYVGG